VECLALPVHLARVVFPARMVPRVQKVPVARQLWVHPDRVVLRDTPVRLAIVALRAALVTKVLSVFPGLRVPVVYLARAARLASVERLVMWVVTATVVLLVRQVPLVQLVPRAVRVVLVHTESLVAVDQVAPADLPALLAARVHPANLVLRGHVVPEALSVMVGIVARLDIPARILSSSQRRRLRRTASLLLVPLRLPRPQLLPRLWRGAPSRVV